MPLTPANSGQLGADGTQSGACGNEPLAPPIVLNETATILHSTGTKDEFGTVSSAWSDLHENIPCRLERMSNIVEKDAQGEMKSTARWQCDFPVGTDVKPSYRVRIAGAIYEVNGTDAALSGATLLRAYLTKIGR